MKSRILLLLALVFSLVACEKDEVKDAKLEEIDLAKPVYAEKTVAQTKADVENSGVNMVNELKSMNQDPGVKATVNLVSLMSTGSSDEDFQQSRYFKIMSAVQNVSSNKPDAKLMFEALNEDPNSSSVLDEFNSMAGTYEFDFVNGEFNRVPNSSLETITFVFPASIESKSAKKLDGKLIIYKPKVITGSFTALNSSVTELPTELKYELKINDSNVASYNFTASYQSDGIPTSVISKLAIGAFEFKVSYGYKQTNVAVNYSFTHGSTIILDLGASVGGHFTKDSIDTATETVIEIDSSYYVYYNWETGMYDTIYQKWENERTEFYPERVLKNANAHIQLMDVKIAGKIDFANFMKDARGTPIDSAPAIINRHVDLVVVYAKDNKAIAKAEANLSLEVNQVEECDYDYNTGQEKCVVVDNTEKVIGIDLIFADGSKSTLENYFNSGFDKVFDSFNVFIDELNNTYNWDIEHISKTE